MDPRPRGWHRDYAKWFDDASVVVNYACRPPYPEPLFPYLAGLAGSGVVLDAGCGPGDIARPLAPLVRRVDAVDLSPRMIDEGRRRDGGGAANVRWFSSPVEEVGLDGPYDLVVAGDSVHWFEWAVVMPRFAAALSPSGVLAIVVREWFRDPEIRRRLAPLYARFGANPDFQALDPVVELQRRGLVDQIRPHCIGPAPWKPTVPDLIGCHHSQNGFDAERTSASDVRAFDLAITRAFRDLAAEGAISECDGRYDLDVSARVTCCRPLASAAGRG
jgi:SAM-dependent methyltransferase